MKYDIEKEEQQFMNFINDQYNVYKEIDNIYRDYVKLPLLLSDALFTLSKHAGMYAMMRLTNEALENGQEEVDYDDEGNWELVVAVHNKLIDFLSDTVGPHYDQRAIDIDAEDDEDFAKTSLQSLMRPSLKRLASALQKKTILNKMAACRL